MDAPLVMASVECPREEAFLMVLKGQTDGPATAAFHGHIEQCTSCSELLQALARLSALDGADDDILPGQTVSHFRIERRLGSGGMGVVYLATDSELDRTVALKTLLHLDSTSLLRFKAEFRALRTLAHDNLVNLGELFEFEGRWFFSMEHVDGVSFFEYVRPNGCLDENRLRRSLAQLVAGLAALHGAGKGHRDLKPSNVLVTNTGRVVILDFGLAKDFEANDDDANHFAGSIAGTVGYMAPEQVTKTFGPASDWYSVGVMLYEALTGRLPFQGGMKLVLEHKLSREPVEPRELASDAPADLADLCVDLLRIDPAARPSGSELQDRLGCGSVGQEILAVRDQFVGRVAEIARLVELLSRVKRDGRGVTALVHGSSGLGKTALVREFLRSLPPDTLVLSSRCHEREAVPYKAIDEVADGLSRYLAKLPADQVTALLPRDAALLGRVFPVLHHCATLAALPVSTSTLDPQEQRERVFAALRELLARISRRTTLVVAIDDLQWTDSDSVVLLRALLTGDDPPRMLLLLTFRTQEPHPARLTLDSLRVQLAEAIECIELEPLTEDDARTLAASLLADRADGVVSDDLLAEARGSPLFIEVLARHRAVDRAGGVMLEDALWARVRELDDRARELLQLVSLAGGPITQEAAARASRLRTDEQAWMTGTLRTHRLVSSDGLRPSDTIEPYHDRVREAVVANMSAAVRLDHHRRLALAFESVEDVDAEMIAVHFGEAGLTDKARGYFLRAAAEATEVLAFERSARLYQRALDTTANDGGDRRRNLVLLGDALVNAGRGYEAARAHLAAASVDSSGEPDEHELKRRASEQLLKSGHVPEAVATLGDLLGSVNVVLPKTPRRALATLLWRRVRLWVRGLRFDERPESAIPADELRRIDTCWSVATGLINVDTIRGAGILSLHLLLALRAGEPKRLALALACEALSRSLGGARDNPGVVRLLADAERLASGHSDPYGLAYVRLAGGAAHFHRGEWRQARGLFEETKQQLATQRGITFELVNASFFELSCLFFLGEMTLLAERIPILLSDADRRGDYYQGSNARLSFFNSVWLAQDDPERARREADEAIARWPEDEYTATHFYHLQAQVNIDLYSGGGAAWGRIEAEWPRLERSFFLRVVTVRTIALFQRAQAALGKLASDEDRANVRVVRRVARRCADKLRAGPVDYGVVLAGLVDAGLLIEAGEHVTAIATLDRCSRELDTLDMPLYAAAARRRLGELTGDDRGRALIADADAHLAREGVRDPKRFSRTLVAG